VRGSIHWVVVAAGVGSRLSAETRKAGVALLGVPMVVHSMRAVAGAPGSVGGTLVVHPDDLGRAAEEWIPALEQASSWSVVTGGATRAESVARGVEAAPETAEWIGVHDAARPLLDPGDLDRLLARMAEPGEAGGDGAGELAGAILAAPVADTLQRVDGDRIVETVDRSILRAAQTPQVFTRAAWRAARERGECAGTDEASWLVASGLEVRVVEARRPNPKVTVAADLRTCEAHLRARA